MKIVLPFLLSLIAFISMFSACDILDNWALHEIPNDHEFQQTLSDYELFKSPMSELEPTDKFIPFELTTELFTDYASKQRLIMVPENKPIQVNSNGTFHYPDSTLIAKTFYYPSLEIESSLTHHIIETRLLLKINGSWNVAVYEWNRDQTEAYLISKGTKRNVSWMNTEGELQTTRYRIPSLAECTTCHQASDRVIPIGPKLSNMNHSVERNGTHINQIDYLAASRVLSVSHLETIRSLPDWSNPDYPLDLRARAYLDVNCAHCHNPSGIADYTSLFLEYDTSIKKTGILRNKNRIERRIESTRRWEKMPMLGTTVIHKEGVDLIKEYLENL
jgi:uncharacterized repeat protein (TIGR03806 family)